MAPSGIRQCWWNIYGDQTVAITTVRWYVLRCSNNAVLSAMKLWVTSAGADFYERCWQQLSTADFPPKAPVQSFTAIYSQLMCVCIHVLSLDVNAAFWLWSDMSDILCLFLSREEEIRNVGGWAQTWLTCPP